MSSEPRARITAHPGWTILTQKNVLAGLMFMALAILGLWVSRNYPVGTTVRMGTGYVPRLLCWVLLALGCLILFQGLRQPRIASIEDGEGAWGWRPLIFVTASLVVFGLAIERLGLVISIVLLTAIGAIASRTLRPVETAVAAFVLAVLSWAIFIVGLGVTIPVWPEW
jgi:putative tricarboxylic transport membrane protein